MSPRKKQKHQQVEQKTNAVLQTTQEKTGLTHRHMRLIIVLFSFLLYGITLSFDFTLDDTLMITSNSLTKQGISGIGDIFSNDAFVGFFGKDKDLVAGGRYRPLTHAMFAVEYDLFGASPFVGHLMNVILYALLGLIVFQTLLHCFRTTISPGVEWIRFVPFVATLLFLAHPLHTEVVSNIKGRDEILSMAGSMLALLFSLKYIQSHHKKFLFFSFLSLTAGLFSKENTITFLAVIPLAIYFFTQAKFKDYVIVMIPLVLSSAVFLIARYQALGFFMNSSIQTEILNNPFINASKSDEIATVIFTWLIYVKLLIFPHPLTHDYYPWHLNVLSFSNPLVILACVVILSLIVIAILGIKRKSVISFGLFFFIITFSIQSNLLFNIGTFMNERFVFVALLGFAIILAHWLSNIKRVKTKTLFIGLLLILFLFSAKTIARSFAWKNNYTLFTTDVKVSVNSTKCNTSAAEVIIDEAEKEKNPVVAKEMFTQALEYLKHAQELHPTYFGAYDLAGKAAFYLEDYRGSYLYYRKCLELDPEAPIPVNNIYLVALATSGKGRLWEAEEMLLWLVDFAPDSIQYKLELANVFELGGKTSRCIDTLNSLIATYPDYAAAWAKLGEVFGKKLNDLNQSEYYLKKAWELNPKDFSVNENLGIVYGMMGKFELSIEFFMNALAIDANVSRLHTNIGNTYAMMGKKDEADKHFQKASELNKSIP